MATSAWANDNLFDPPPVFSTIDDNGVNVFTGTFNTTVTDVSIGPSGAGGLPYRRSFIGYGWRDNYVGTITHSGATYTVSFGSFSDQFTLSGTTYTPVQGRGTMLTYDAPSQTYTYTTRDGSQAIFAKNIEQSSYDDKDGRVTSFASPDGEKQYYEYQVVRICPDSGCPTEPFDRVRRLKSVSNNRGYKLFFGYSYNTGGAPVSQSNFAAWTTLASVTAFNQGIEICGNTSNPDLCPLTGSWPQSTYALSGSTLTVTDPMLRATTYTYNGSGQITRVHRPASTGSTNDTVVTYVTSRVNSVSNGIGTWNYTYTGLAGGFIRTDVTDSNSNTRTTNTSPQGQLMTVGLGTATPTRYLYYTNGLLQRITKPSGLKIDYVYDPRGNPTTTTVTPSIGTGTLSTSANYDATCANPVKCNKPNYTIDQSGYETDYTYHPTYGVVTSIKLPGLNGAAPLGTAPRPELRPTHALRNAAYLVNVGGVPTMTPSPDQIYVDTGYSVCSSGSSCAGTANETTETIGRAAIAPTNYNNLLPSVVTMAAGDGSLSAGTRLTFDQIGNMATVDPPGSGSDPRYFRYDANRELTGVIYPGPNPGSTKYRATTLDYNGDGLVTVISQGTVTSATGWSSFAAKSVLTTTYDGIDRVIKSTLAVDGTNQAITQVAYDNANRRTCTAVRLKLTSLPASACTSATVPSPDGPDRIEQLSYNSLNQVTTVTQALHEADQRDYARYTYTDDNQFYELTDANGNKTTYEYDGYDRLQKIRYPDPATPGVSSTTDFVQYGYDPNSRIVSFRLRDATSTTYQYYNTGWLKRRDPPGGVNDIDYGYDLFGRQTSAASPSQTLTYNYDALSRLTSEVSSALGAVSYDYDPAGHRTKMTWPDGVFVTYDIDPIGEVTAIRESGVLTGPRVLAQYTYDDLGRRLTLTRGNGVNTTYHYTGAWLDTLTQGVAAPNAQTLTFDHNAAGQISSRTSNNDVYAWDGAANLNDTYTANGLNQIKKLNTVNFGYDTNGNLTSDGANTYGYDSLNNLTSVSGAHTMTATYDPSGRLYRTTGTLNRRYLYDGATIIAEFDGTGAITDRYVFGPEADEALTWYVGSGVTNRNWFIADERGSITAITKASGVASTVNRYDEYGRPGTANAGRFQFTGQAYLSDADLYYYKARTYLPGIGRFMQTDPLGLTSGMNLYAYVANDPFNLTDPTGLDCVGINDPNCNAVGEVVVQGTPPPSVVLLPPPPPLLPVTMDIPDLSNITIDSTTTSDDAVCAGALATAQKDRNAVSRAQAEWATISAAAAANGIDPALLAAVGIRESGFRNIHQTGGGQGAGVFQIDLGAHPNVTSAQAFNIPWAANYAAGLLASNSANISGRFPNFTPAQTLQATAASYNFGTGNIRGNPANIDVGTTGNNYGSNVAGLTHCFAGN